MSSAERRANSASVHGPLGGTPSARSSSKTSRSMKFRAAGGSQAGAPSSSETVIRATATRPANRATIAASPAPSRASTRPRSSTTARSGAFDWYRAW